MHEWLKAEAAEGAARFARVAKAFGEQYAAKFHSRTTGRLNWVEKDVPEWVIDQMQRDLDLFRLYQAANPEFPLYTLPPGAVAGGKVVATTSAPVATPPTEREDNTDANS